MNLFYPIKPRQLVFSYYLPFLLIILGLLLRAYSSGTYPFAFDQVQILQNVDSIVSGKLTLIGPRTGPASMFTGPLIYYLAAGLRFIISPPFMLVAVSLTISLVTGLAIWLIGRHYFPPAKYTALIAIWALSPFIISLDRITWNPNLSLLSSSLVFLPLFYSVTTGRRLQPLDYCLIVAGGFLGYQAHFSGFILPLLVVAVWLIFLRPQYWVVLASVAGLALSLLPTLVFDLRHHWLNYRGLVELLTNRDKVHNFELLPRFVSKSLISLQNMGRIFFQGVEIVPTHQLGLMLLGLVVVYAYLTNRQAKRALLFILAWVGFIALAISLFKESTPEYYFMIQVPAWMMLGAYFFAWISKYKPTVLAAYFLFAVYSVNYVVRTYSQVDGLTISNSVNIVDYVNHYHEIYPISELRYDMAPVNQLGLRYMFRNLSTDPTGSIVHLMYPVSPNDKLEYRSGWIGLWLQQ